LPDKQSGKSDKKSDQESDTNPSLRAGFIDALIAYAMDPLQWEAVAAELDEDADRLKNLDPSTLLAVLSQAEALASSIIKSHVPVLSDALGHVGHDQTRNRGTVGGSLANADPAAELPLIAQLLEAEIVARSTGGERVIPAAAFFEAAMATALAPDECLTEIRFPIWPSQLTGHGFCEVSIRDSDFALAAAGVQLALDANGTCRRLNIAIGGASPAPMRLSDIEAALTGTDLDTDMVRAETARIATMVDPQGDVHADAAYRRRVARVMTERALLSARDHAMGAAP